MPVARRVEQVRQQLARAGIRDAIRNVSWLGGERVVQIAVGMFVGVWAARALGPTRYGLFNYALAFATMFAGFANLGMDSVVVRDLVREPARAVVIVGTAFRLRALAAVVVAGLIAAAAVAAHHREPLTLVLILIFTLSTLLKPFDVVDLWFQAKTRLGPIVRARTVAYLLGSAFRVGVLVVAGGVLVPLAIVEPLTATLAAGFFVLLLRRSEPGVPGAGSWDGATARAILRDSWPLLIASLGVVVYMRLDQIMLENLGGVAGTHELGLYSAALRLSETWYLIPTAVVTAVFPHIVNSRKEGPAIYELRMTQLFSFMTAAALGVAIPMTLVARPLVSLLFGASFVGAGPILAVHIWTTLFVFWGVVGSAWFVNEDLVRVATVRSLQGAVINVALNLWLIPRYGGLGAAVATLVSQACAVFLLNLTDARTRLLVRLQARSLLLRGLLS